ncbi:beta family protein, partial [Burkholderia cepacia]
MADYDNHAYFPALMSRVAEIQGLRQLSDERKERIIPLFTLGRWHNAVEFDRAIQNCSAAV